MDERNDKRSLENELSNIRTELSAIRSLLSSPANSSARPADRLKVFIKQTEGERKPYTALFSGLFSATFKLSSLRTAIFLGLLLDLQDRLEGGPGFPDVQEAIYRIYKELDENFEQNEKTSNNMRVALYRFEGFLASEQEQNHEDWKFEFDSKGLSLSLISRNGPATTGKADIEVSSSDSRVMRAIGRVSHASPLTQARKRKAAYVAPGAEGFDRLLLELYDHTFELRTNTMLFRISPISYPIDLLKRTSASEAVLRRNELVKEALESGRLHFTEFINTSTLLALNKRDNEGYLEAYPRISDESVISQHLEFLRKRLEAIPNYELLITDVAFPFFLGTYEIRSEARPELLTLFFRRDRTEFHNGASCFVVADRMLGQSVVGHIIEWLASHPSTVRGKSRAIERLIEIEQQLLSG